MLKEVAVVSDNTSEGDGDMFFLGAVTETKPAVIEQPDTDNK